MTPATECALARGPEDPRDDLGPLRRSASRPGPQGPDFAGAPTTAPVRTLFDATDGLA